MNQKRTTANELAEQLEFDSVDELFYYLVSNINSAFLSLNFKKLNSMSQSRFLKYCNENDFIDAYNYYHTLI